MFSARTSSLDTSAWKEPETAADLILRLTACLLHELRLGSESRWFGWLQFVPRDVIRVRTLWANLDIGGEDGRRGLEWLEGTEAGLELRKKDQEGLSLVSASPPPPPYKIVDQIDLIQPDFTVDDAHTCRPIWRATIPPSSSRPPPPTPIPAPSRPSCTPTP